MGAGGASYHYYYIARHKSVSVSRTPAPTFSLRVDALHQSQPSPLFSLLDLGLEGIWYWLRTSAAGGKLAAEAMREIKDAIR